MLLLSYYNLFIIAMIFSTVFATPIPWEISHQKHLAQNVNIPINNILQKRQQTRTHHHHHHTNTKQAHATKTIAQN